MYLKIHSLLCRLKNKLRDGEMEHAFILGSLDCVVVNMDKDMELDVERTGAMDTRQRHSCFQPKIRRHGLFIVAITTDFSSQIPL